MARMLFIQTQKYAYPGLYYLCGALKAAGHDYRVVHGTGLGQLKPVFEAFQPQLVGFSCMTGAHRGIVALSADIKASYPDVRTILGGVHPTLYPGVLTHPAVDFICRGEGEAPLTELLDALDRGDRDFPIANIHYKKADGSLVETPMRDLVFPMDDLPFPDYGAYREIPEVMADEYPMVFFGRGCPYSCSYCHNSNQRSLYKGLGKYVRTFGVERILDETQAALDHYPHARAVLLGTDTFGAKKGFTRDLLTRFHETFTVPYTCLIRPELINEDLARLLGETGCHMVAFGVESGSERVRGELLYRRYSNDAVIEGAEMLRRNGVEFRTYNIVGFPSETRTEMLETLELNMRIRPEFPWASIYTPYPETALADYSMKNGYLRTDFTFDDVPLSFFNDTLLSNVDRNFIRNVHAFFQTFVLAPYLYPLFKWLLYLPHNVLFGLVFKAVYSYICIRSENRTLWGFLKLALSNRHLFARRRKSNRLFSTLLGTDNG